MTVSIGFIGAGSMGGAMISGLAASRELRILGYDPDRVKLENLQKGCGLIPVDDFSALCRQSDYIFLAVKPGIMKEAVSQVSVHLSPSQCLVSIAAGITIPRIISWSGDKYPVVRIMPNTPALVGKGVFALCLDHERISSSQRDFLTATVSSLGRTFILPERYFDAFTALIGSGPAYVYYFMESMVEAGVLLGLDRTTGADMVRHLFAGSSEMSLGRDKSITELKEMVTSPGGTTIAGLSVLDRKAVRAAIMQAVESAARRSRELDQD